MIKNTVILQHVPNEDAGTLLAFLKENELPYRTVPLYEPEAVFPALDSVAAVIVMGGPMNVYEEDAYPFLRAENQWIQEIIKQNIPYLGICLGAQLLAKALGARVYKGPQPEIGWDTVRLTKERKDLGLFGGLEPGKELKVLQWHEDTFDLPQGAVLLASSRLIPNQAFRYKNLFYGLQFHIEVDRAMLENWFQGNERLAAILREYESYKNTLEQITQDLYRRFFNTLLAKSPRKIF